MCTCENQKDQTMTIKPKTQQARLQMFIFHVHQPSHFGRFVTKKQICIRLVTTDQSGQKNRNGKTIVVLFYHVFY